MDFFHHFSWADILKLTLEEPCNTKHFAVDISCSLLTILYVTKTHPKGCISVNLWKLLNVGTDRRTVTEEASHVALIWLYLHNFHTIFRKIPHMNMKKISIRYRSCNGIIRNNHCRSLIKRHCAFRLNGMGNCTASEHEYTSFHGWRFAWGMRNVPLSWSYQSKAIVLLARGRNMKVYQNMPFGGYA